MKTRVVALIKRAEESTTVRGFVICLTLKSWHLIVS